jgi:hypothetical protein
LKARRWPECNAGELQLIVHPTRRRLDVDRVIALPGVEGPAVPGTTQDDAGFIVVDQRGLMRDSTCVWAAGDQPERCSAPT